MQKRDRVVTVRSGIGQYCSAQYSTDVAVSARTMPICTEYGSRSQIRPKTYQKVLRGTAQSSTIPVSPTDRVPYSTDVATSPRTVPICTEYGCCSQIRLKLYGHVLHSTSQRSAVPVSPPHRAPYLSVRNIAAEAKSDCNCTDIYYAVSLGAARCRCPHLAVHCTYLYGIWLPKPNQPVIVQTYTA
jgi:hypothetical protein